MKMAEKGSEGVQNYSFGQNKSGLFCCRKTPKDLKLRVQKFSTKITNYSALQLQDT